MRYGRVSTASLVAILVTAGCSDDGDDSTPISSPPIPLTSSDTPSPTPEERSPTPTASSPTVPPGPVTPTNPEDLVTDLNTPWDVAFLPDGSALVSSRDTGEVLRVTDDGSAETVGEVSGAVEGSEGGLLGLAVPPGGTGESVTVYAYLTTEDDNRIVRMPLTSGRLGEPEVILDGLQRGQRHQGGRMTFGPDGMLYVGVGDAGAQSQAQNVDGTLNGKILRMTPDGDVPADNPFDGSLIYSYGHRNVQGLAFDDDGRLWASEFGQNTWDELNLIEAGGNYGWPEVEGSADTDEYIDPVAQWSTEEASPSGIAYYRDTIFMAALRGQRLWQIPVDGREAGEPTAYFTGEYGRLRHVVVAPDGSLWVLTNNTDGRGNPVAGDDRILRIEVTRQ